MNTEKTAKNGELEEIISPSKYRVLPRQREAVEAVAIGLMNEVSIPHNIREFLTEPVGKAYRDVVIKYANLMEDLFSHIADVLMQKSMKLNGGILQITNGPLANLALSALAKAEVYRTMRDDYSIRE